MMFETSLLRAGISSPFHSMLCFNNFVAAAWHHLMAQFDHHHTGAVERQWHQQWNERQCHNRRHGASHRSQLDIECGREQRLELLQRERARQHGRTAAD